ncbi:MAG: hypothetical protein WEA59_07285 [Ferruginibacter sp.]
MKRTLPFLLIVLCCFSGLYFDLKAQSIQGIWTGKISRRSATAGASESLEIQISQTGNFLWGHSFASKDTSRFVLYKLEGKRNKKEQSISLKEIGQPAYSLPDAFFPCEKVYKLEYYRIGNTQYLSGTWGGRGAFMDTTCFPNEELLVVLQKIKSPDYPINSFVTKKLVNYFTRKNELRIMDSSTIEEKIMEQQWDNPSNKTGRDSILITDRRQDIQEILQTTDSNIRISLYDNATIDDDTVSIFVNKLPVLLQQRLSARAYVFEIKAPVPGKPVEILMQAENLGSIPPNTALMVVETGKKRYEVRMSAGYDKHAVLIITYLPD